jgi:hypothetical protein
MVLHDQLGGVLIRGEVLVNGEHRDYHWWNRLAVEIDMTREQFSAEEIVSGGVVIARAPASTWRRLREEYEILRSRVQESRGAGLGWPRRHRQATAPPGSRSCRLGSQARQDLVSCLAEAAGLA